MNDWWRWAGIVCLFSLAACERDPIAFRTPEGVPPTSNRLEVQVGVDPSSQSPDAAWVDGIPSAAVAALLVRDFKEMIAESTSTDLAGRAALPLDDHPGGTYWVFGKRRIDADSAAEAGLLIPVLAGGRKISVHGPTADTLALRPPERGTLLISEGSFNSPPPWETDNYPSRVSAYIEILNNSETTTYIDGILLGQMYTWWRDYTRSGHHSCSETEPMRNDPEGIWSTYILQFPGDGTDHPIEPGSRILVAVSATDHSLAHPALADLSGADFEVAVGSALGGGAVADNPDAPNLEDVGPSQVFSNMFSLVSAGWYLADPVDLDVLPRMTDPGAYFGNIFDYVRIPAEAIRDVVIIWWDNSKGYTSTGGSPICRDPVHPSFDAIPGAFLEGQSNPDTWTWSAHRRMVRGVDGRMYGLDTNVSAVDFIQAPMTPGGPPPEGYREAWQW